jgi:transposase
MWYVGLDVHRETTAVSLRNSRGVVVRREVVATTANALRRALRGIRGRARVICESGPLVPWVRDTLETRFREIVVCDRRRTRLATSGAKTDRIDADKLSDLLRKDAVHLVHVPRGDHALMRRLASHYVKMLRERSRIIARLRSLFIEVGVRVKTHRAAPERVPLSRLSRPGTRLIADAYIRQLEVASAVVVEARNALIHQASLSRAFALLQTVPHVGEVRAAEILAIVGDPHRFRSLRTFWSYAGLGVVQSVSAEHKVQNGRIVRGEKRRGVRLARAGHPLLKKVMRDLALYGSVGRGIFREVYDRHISRGKTPAIARIALARKFAAVIFAVWRNDSPFTESLVR